ncbi:type IIL restriction-modification enzyme MmeI [Gemmiger sp.]|uniref:type IIL restriction-modification enzyme MmeI n=1 Tax=Gemmiger sp. TaxID=2049027 RepID=UPI0031F3254B
MKNSNNGKRGFGPAFPLVRSKSRWYNNIIIRCGRLKSDYRYSNTLVYNNFPWPTTTEQQKLKIEQTAQAILDARALYPDSSLADLYDELTMPPELRKAHQANDRAVMDAYGFVKGSPARTSESACVAELMKMYQTLTSK